MDPRTEVSSLKQGGGGEKGLNSNLRTNCNNQNENDHLNTMSHELHIFDSEGSSEKKYTGNLKFQNQNLNGNRINGLSSSQEKIKFYDAASAGNLQSHVPLSQMLESKLPKVIS